MNGLHGTHVPDDVPDDVPDSVPISVPDSVPSRVPDGVPTPVVATRHSTVWPPSGAKSRNFAGG